MQFGIADYGMNVWDGGCFDIEQRLRDLKDIGYEGIERLAGNAAEELVQNAGIFRKLGMHFTTVRGPSIESTIRWGAAFGVDYVWVQVAARELDGFCRQANVQAEACERWGLVAGLHNHLGSPAESQEQVETFLERCPKVKLVLDTAHLAAAGGDPVEIVKKYPDRLAVVHLKDWLVTNPEIGLDRWPQRGRFCELNAGNIGLDNIAVMKALEEVGYDGWVHIEHDTHLQDPLKDLSISRQVLRDAGY